MFQDCDLETIKAVLASNNGHVERTIEDLLKMTSEAGGEDPNDDNLFADYSQNNKSRPNRNDDLFGIDDEPKGNRFEDLGIFQENPSRPKPSGNVREMQEKADAELAYRLQKEEIAYEKEIERQESRQQGRRPQGGNAQGGNAPGWDFSAPPQQYQQQSGSRYGQPPSQMPQESGEKKKSGIMSKVKTGISSIFNKTKSNLSKPKGPTHNPGQYAEIDNLDDQQEIYQFSNGGNSNQNMGVHQFQGDNNNNYEDAPMQLSDILNPRGMSNLRNDDSDEDNNNNNNRNYRNNNGGGISNDHFDFH